MSAASLPTSSATPSARLDAGTRRLLLAPPRSDLPAGYFDAILARRGQRAAPATPGIPLRWWRTIRRWLAQSSRA